MNRLKLSHRILGSPPRGRGKVVLHCGVVLDVGITPAWAGKRGGRYYGVADKQDHPRVGGEKCSSSILPRCRRGSPPRGRGKARMLSSFGPFRGSPPRGRGKVPETYRYVAGYGITPAWAGKSAKHWFKQRKNRDHPRVGGEKIERLLGMDCDTGSPPRGRGKGVYEIDTELRYGITPAWAGKRLKRSHRSGIFISGPIPFHSVLHRPAGSGGSRAGRDGSPAGQPQNTGPA